jgi:hypothetical protein
MIPQTAPQGRIDMGCADTTPGAACVLAPPAGVTLAPVVYTRIMRRKLYTREIRVRGKRADGQPRTKTVAADPLAAQQLVAFARRLKPSDTNPRLRIVGPHAAEARAILESLAERRREPAR